MKQDEMRKIAKDYLYLDLLQSERDLYPVECFDLNRALNYYLCDSFSRLIKADVEVVKKDVYLLVESWMMAKSLIVKNIDDPGKPLIPNCAYNDRKRMIEAGLTLE